MNAALTAVFIGDGSLLIQCAQAWAGAGHVIHAIATRSVAVRDWALERGVAVELIDTVDEQLFSGHDVDYLFSVANLQLLPPAVLARPRAMAINFHDGPLPRYAGLNATSWALMGRERSHGVTWHEMTTGVDRGRILSRAAFALEAGETALSLNARCYEAGLATFVSLVDAIGRGALAPTAQSGERSYFARDQRPEALGVLDFTRTAQQLEALVRALDFGTYANPLARPKLYLGDRLLYVGSARVDAAGPPAAPGTVIGNAGGELRVACGDGAIVLSQFSDDTGPGAPPSMDAGAVLPRLPADLRAQLSQRQAAIAQGEAFWRRALSEAQAVALPYPRRLGGASTASAAPSPMALALAGVPRETAAAGFLCWLAAVTAQPRVSVRFADATLRAQADALPLFLTPWVPMTLAIDPHTPAADALAQAHRALDRIRAAGPCSRDLPSRLGDVPGAGADLRRIALSLDGGPLPPGTELALVADAAGSFQLHADAAVYEGGTLELMAAHLAAYLGAFAAAAADPGTALAQVSLRPAPEAAAAHAANATGASVADAGSVSDWLLAQLAQQPDRTALECAGDMLTAAELDRRSATLARALQARGVAAGDVVGLCLPRSTELVVALLGILRAGAAYLPLDPAYPHERLAFMIADSGARTVVCTPALAQALSLPDERVLVPQAAPPAAADEAPLAAPTPDAGRPAYLIYTSGSTGQPKGVLVTHGNVLNFFAGMDARVPRQAGGRWLAVTSLSFDISVLELLWTLTRGFTVVLQADTPAAAPARPMDFSLFYFASASDAPAQERYRLLMEGAKFADREGFAAVWTPERHFHAFGGLYPNPAVTSAALAAATTRIGIRAGSCVLPLHHPIRVAEDWAFVDNISQGRVGVSFASGWQPQDFALAPGAFAGRKDAMLEAMAVVRRLWRGEAVDFPGPLGKPVAVQTLPRPVQQEIPVWLTAAGNPETFEQAGTLGCHLLTHLLGQRLDDVATKLQLYRAAWRRAGHAGSGHVTLMLHTFVGDDEAQVRETVRAPMKAYLRSSVDLIRQAAWSFPTFVQRAAADGRNPVEVMEAAPLSEAEMDALLEHAFERYYETSGLFGTTARCLERVAALRESGIDEIACLIDFGIETDAVLAHLHDLKRVMDAAHASKPVARRATVATQILQDGITHLQCTPSMAAMLAADADGREALSRLAALLVGGEALPLPLARELTARVPGRVLNMYGPTETTVWSTTAELRELADFVPLGTPIANTQLHIRNGWGLDCPALVPGELLIGGAGVARGYLGRDALTAERFVADPAQPGARLYRTGDLVRRHPDGALEFLGRIDHQVKLRGHRIELGEIEAVLMRQSGVRQAVAVAQGEGAQDQVLVAYVTAVPGRSLDADALRAALAQALPEVMVPARVGVMPSLPLTPNGKIDRRALPPLRAGRPAAAATAPQGVSAPVPASRADDPMQQTVAGVWKDVLGVPEVGLDDNFFDLGGHSLLVVQVQRRLREVTGSELSITDMFRLPTVRALAARLGAGSAAASAASTAVNDGLNRAMARRVSRSRGAPTTPVA